MIKTVLNAAKNAKGWSNQKLAEAAKLPLSTVTNILGEGSKTENPRWDTVTILARTLGVPLNALEDETPPEAPKPNTVSEAAAYYDAAKKYLLSQVEHEREEKEKERAERKRWQRAAISMAALLVVILILMLTIILIDLRTPSAGWFRVS